MRAERLLHHPLLGSLPNVPSVTFTFNGRPVEGRDGESIAAALWAAGIRVLRLAGRGREPRGLYCGIGHCYECRVTVNGVPNLRACMEPVRSHLKVEGGWDQGVSTDER